MPYSMIHVNIALKILEANNEIKNPGDFLLGALAPDAVHYRDNYDSDMKYKSHFCIGDEKWGSITNNDEWEKEILKKFKREINDDNSDFIYGYCSHVLADVQNNRKVFLPFMAAIKNKKTPGFRQQYYDESVALDFELYNRSNQKLIKDLLSKSRAYEIAGIILPSEIKDLKDDFLEERFRGRELEDTSNHEYVTLEGMQKFIEEESQHIIDLLFLKNTYQMNRSI